MIVSYGIGIGFAGFLENTDIIDGIGIGELYRELLDSNIIIENIMIE